MGMKAIIHNGRFLFPRMCYACKDHIIDPNHAHLVYITGEGSFYLCDRCREEFERVIRFKNSSNIMFKVRRWLLVKQTSVKPETIQS